MKPNDVTLPLLPLLILLGACSDSGANYTPILDGAPRAGFQSDLAACQMLARDQKQFDQETMGAAAIGAGLGAALGAAEGDGDKAGDIAGGLIAGALAGGAAGAISAQERRESIVKDCLRGRGHKVVG